MFGPSPSPEPFRFPSPHRVLVPDAALGPFVTSELHYDRVSKATVGTVLSGGRHYTVKLDGRTGRRVIEEAESTYGFGAFFNTITAWFVTRSPELTNDSVDSTGSEYEYDPHGRLEMKYGVTREQVKAFRKKKKKEKKDFKALTDSRARGWAPEHWYRREIELQELREKGIETHGRANYRRMRKELMFRSILQDEAEQTQAAKKTKEEHDAAQKPVPVVRVEAIKLRSGSPFESVQAIFGGRTSPNPFPCRVSPLIVPREDRF